MLRHAHSPGSRRQPGPIGLPAQQHRPRPRPGLGAAGRADGRAGLAGDAGGNAADRQCRLARARPRRRRPGAARRRPAALGLGGGGLPQGRRQRLRPARPQDRHPRRHDAAGRDRCRAGGGDRPRGRPCAGRPCGRAHQHRHGHRGRGGDRRGGPGRRRRGRLGNHRPGAGAGGRIRHHAALFAQPGTGGRPRRAGADGAGRLRPQASGGAVAEDERGRRRPPAHLPVHPPRPRRAHNPHRGHAARGDAGLAQGGVRTDSVVPAQAGTQESRTRCRCTDGGITTETQRHRGVTEKDVFSLCLLCVSVSLW
ncbi:hypothetical protein MTBUT4_120072 [Magnetospirillum sp. UT-4]|nr:hypothetical protein MTBUT4_120072 [Magnetospirillum sp. UT-4]